MSIYSSFGSSLLTKYFCAVSFVLITFFSNAQCDLIQPDLGNDTTFCESVNVNLTLSPGNFDYYLWDNNSTSPTRIINTPGIYTVQVGTIDYLTNLVINGDFEAGNSGFTSQYNYTTTVTSYGNILGLAGYYTITGNPGSVHAGFTNCTDLTPNPGNKMMAVNGAADYNKKVWCQNITVEPNTDYLFSANAASVLLPQYTASPAQLNFTINNTLIGSTSTLSNIACNWTSFNQTWNSGITTSAQICIVNQNIIADGNDFILDEIAFHKICYQYDTISVATETIPNISIGGPDNICAGDTITLQLNPTITNHLINWQPTNETTNSISVSPNQSQTYIVSIEGEFGCVKTAQKNVTVQPLPLFNILLTDSIICAGNSSTWEIHPSDINNNILVDPLVIGNNNIFTDSPTTSTWYHVESISPFGCTFEDSLYIQVIENITTPVVNISAPSICKGDTVTLTIQDPNQNLVYEWNFNEIGPNYTIIANENSTIQLNTTDIIGCFSNSINIPIIVNDHPFINIETSNVLLCEGQDVTLELQSTEQLNNIVWSSTNNTSTSITESVLVTTTFYVSASNIHGCSSSDSITIQVSSVSIETTANNSTICIGDTITLNANSSLPATNFTWSTGQTTSTINFSPNQSQYIYLNGASIHCPNELDSIYITVLDLPIINAIEDQTICPGEEVNIQVSTTPSTSTINIFSLNDPTNSSSTNYPTESGAYGAFATLHGCTSDTIFFQITIGEYCDDLAIPNVFSPNNDGLNDFFQLSNVGIFKEFHCIILNRWGQIIQEFSNANLSWNGQDKNGIDVTDGVYFYIIEYETMKESKLTKEGFITLIR